MLVIIIIALVLFFPAAADIDYDTKNGLAVSARIYLFFKLKLYPRVPKKEKKQQKQAEQAQQAAAPAEKKGKSKHDAIELLEYARQLLPQAAKMLSVLRRTFYISIIRLRLTVSDDDAAETALKYGRANTLVWTLAGMLAASFNATPKPDIYISPDFNTQNESLSLKIRINICIFAAILIIIFFAVKALAIIVKDKASDKSAETRQRQQHTHRGGSGEKG